TATCAPARANWRQIAAPMPPPPPVTIARCPSSVPTAADPVTSIATARRLRSQPMDQEAMRRRLAEEHDRLDEIRAGFDAEHLHDETEDDSMPALPPLAQHSADVASETFEREKDFSILEQVEAELADVERALERIDDGRYGKCDACGGEIGDDRLEAMPAA